MNITFRLRFGTHPGQSLSLSGRHPLHYVDHEFWEATIALPDSETNSALNYNYTLHQPDGAQIADWDGSRTIVPVRFKCAELQVIDSWNHPRFLENVFFTAPFKNVLLAENFTAVKSVATPSPTHTFRVQAPQLKKNQTICLLGESSVLGQWNPQTAVLLNRQPDEDYFSVTLNLRGQSFPLAYKYGVFDVEKNNFVRYEDGANRILSDEIAPNKYTLVNDGFIRLPVELWRGAGVAIPVFSLRSEKSFGIGEFADLKPLADWGKKTGLKLIQLLPINDTSATFTWQDSYPYAAISALALHPAYLNLDAVASAGNKKLLKELEPERQRLNALDAVDYKAVIKAKLAFLKKIFPLQKQAAFGAAEFKKFFTENEHWLLPYAVFCFLRDKFGTADFSRWPEHRIFDAEKIRALATNNDAVAFHYFVQYHLHLQLKDAAAHIHAAGLVLKGDIAIGVFRHGVDAWQQPELFNLDLQAGAPPDPFSAKGQNWGFPTYNWPRMAADGFAWWKHRFAQMGIYFDAFRIDHILGFFRIWSSPAHAVEGILGYFVPALALEEKEFSERGIIFNRDRFLKPFITDAVLQEIFGEKTDFIRHEFLQPNTGAADASKSYALKSQFATQRQVENHFAALEQNDRNTKLKLGLFDLISNVILLEVNGEFHFRFAMEQTLSFKNLPPDAQAKLHDLYVDYFFRRQDDFWKREAMQKLPALKRVTDMLICGEDLGLVPACVPDVMRDLGFLSLEIQRMPKAMGADFSRPAKAPYLSVVTPSTHDMSTIRGWWLEDHEQTQKFFNHELGLTGVAPPTAEPWIVQKIVQQHLDSPAMWSIFQLQELLGMDGDLRRADIASERINVPALPNFYWHYRMHRTLEKLLQADEFNSRLKQLIANSGR